MNTSTNTKKWLVPKSKQPGIIKRNRHKAMRFLYDEPYTTAPVIKKLLGYESIQGANAFLNKLEKLEFAKRKETADFSGRKLTIWGITKTGMSATFIFDEHASKRRRPFDISKIYLSTLNHLTTIQNLKCDIINSGSNLKVVGIDHSKYKRKMPDILLYDENKDKYFAMEIELTVKSKRRYKEIIGEYRRLISNNLISHIVWITDNESDKKRLTNIFKETGKSDNHEIITLDEAVAIFQE